MSALLRIAVRNTLRNRRRSLFTLISIAFGTAALIAICGASRGIIDLLTSSAVDGQTGSILIYHAGYFDRAREGRLLSLTLPYDDAMRARIAAVEGVAAVTGRIRFSGSLSQDAAHANVLGLALDPEREPAVCADYRKYYDLKRQGLAPGDGNVVLLGPELAAGLSAAPPPEDAKDLAGYALDRLSLSSTSPEGRNGVVDLHVKGLSLGGLGGLAPKNLAVLPLATVQRLLNLDGRVTEIGVAIAPDAALDATIARLAAALGPGVEVHSWEKLVPLVPNTARQHRFLIGLISMILALFVTFGIVNTMMMCVQERTREIGTMTALGTERAQVAWIFAGEALCLGVAGGILGLALGIAVTMAANRIGIPLGRTSVIFENGIRPVVLPDVALAATLGVTLVSLAAGLAPAWKAARLSPASALRAN